MLGVKVLQEIMHNLYNRNQDGKLLSAFGEVFISRVKLYVYPSMDTTRNEIINCDNMIIPEKIKFLYRHLRECDQIEDVKNYDPSILHIFSKEVLSMIRLGVSGWEEKVTPKVYQLIKENKLFTSRKTAKVS